MASPSNLLSSILSLPRLHDDGIPTASIAILSAGKTTTHILTSGPENAETVYQAASISKAITSLAVARLVDQGKLRYDTKVVDHLDPGLVDVMVDERTRHLIGHVDVRMLVSHTSGLSQHGFPGYGTEAEVARPEDIIAGRYPSNTPRMRFVSFPGAQCCYCGGGFVLLQLMLERILGKPFPEIMHETVLEPLGMTRSWYGDLPAGETNFTRTHFTAYTRSEMGRGYNVLPELAAAGLWTTPTDLLKAVSAIQDSLQNSTSSTTFIAQSTAQHLLTPILSSGSIGTFGLGWVVNAVSFGHGGDNWPGFNAYLAGFRNGKNGVAFMMNSVLGHQECTKQILAAVMWAQGWKGSEVEGEIWMPNLRDGFVPYAAPESTSVSSDWELWKGEWEGGFEIVERGGGPALKFGEFSAMRLKAAAAPVREYQGGKKEVWLVVDGLKMGVRLTWDEEGKAETVVKLQLEEGKVLKRATS